MSEIITSDPLSTTSEKPVLDHDSNEIVKFPPFPEPTDDAFEEDISEEERSYYKNKFPDLNAIKHEKLHCTACDRHLGCSARNESRMRVHPMLRTLVCHTCHTFYNSGEFDKGDDGSELYCRWCGQGGQVYCCSDCPIVFCAKCIKRNFGMPKIKEIENTDDWKCFKCNPNCLWDLRAVCWALLRYCDLRNKASYQTQDATMKELYQKACSVDESECCKSKMSKRKEKEARKKELDAVKVEYQRAAASKAATAINIMTKIPPTIQVKKFASINLDESPPKEKKAQKRPKEEKDKHILKNPITINKFIPMPMLSKKPRLQVPNMVSMAPIRMPPVVKSYQNYPRIRPKPPLNQMTVINSYLNNRIDNLVNNFTNDNINLSLESLTQGLDMSSISNISGMSDSDVVCTPDFPLEPLCEMNEGVDDDVECMTPAPAVVPSPVSAPGSVPAPPPPPLAPVRPLDDNIIQMTENDVTVNAVTGGLKFRVDPQTLSANKMYRLPDGRIFAINANPNMPGGYSATIVALADNSSPAMRAPPKGSTFAAKLSAVPAPPASPAPPAPASARRTLTPTPRILAGGKRTRPPPRRAAREPPPRAASPAPAPAPAPAQARTCDLKIPVEWFRYNLIDAVDALEYSLSRLHKLKREATTMHLRTRTLDEMRALHKTLDSMLKTSSCRFTEIRDSLNKEMKNFVRKKTATCDVSSDDDADDDDDVEILNDAPDDPIFIDENSMESNTANDTNGNVTGEVDLTGPAGSEHNDSGERPASADRDPPPRPPPAPAPARTPPARTSPARTPPARTSPARTPPARTSPAPDELAGGHRDTSPPPNDARDDESDPAKPDSPQMNGDVERVEDKPDEVKKDNRKEDDDDENDGKLSETEKADDSCTNSPKESEGREDDTDGPEKQPKSEKLDGDAPAEDKLDESETGANEIKADGADESQDKLQDNDMTEELIDSLLKDDNLGVDASENFNSMDIPEDFPEP